MINVESGGDPQARSGAGAAGIAQFMSGTWQSTISQHPELVSQYGANPDPSGRFDPIPALYASAAHLSDMLRDAGGNYAVALGGYYAGQGNATGADGQYYANLVLSRLR